MPANDFDTDTMPSARAARAKEWGMLDVVPVYLLLAGLVCICVLGAALIAVIAR